MEFAIKLFGIFLPKKWACLEGVEPEEDREKWNRMS